MQVCSGCGESNPDRFNECAFCGEALAERRATAEERKVLTVVFCDLEGSTVLGETLDPEALGEVLDLYFTAMTRVLERHGGSIQKFIGDAVVAAFGIPVLHEDDALRAVRAAVEMQQAMGRLNRQIQSGYGVSLVARIGVHTGEVVIRTSITGQQVLTGDTLNTAARLEQETSGGEILIGEPTFLLVRDAVEAEQKPPLALKGKAQPVPAYRLIRVFGDEQASRRHDAPIVGRERELGVLADLFERSTAERRCLLATVVGEAGVGKSRLVRALIESTQDRALVLRGRCPPYGDGITFWPLLSMVREAGGIAADDPGDVARRKLDALSGEPEVTRRVAAALGWSGEQLPLAELFWGVRELLASLARDRPMVVIIDDVHWAAPSLIELIEHLVETVESASVLILCTARPDMLEERPEWSSRGRRARLVLDRLSDEVAARVIDNLLGGVPLPELVRAMVIRAAEGNPLFVEQLVSMLIDSEVLIETDGAWQATHGLEHLAVPPSIHALLAARLDMLSAEERAVVEPASVIGLEFPSSAVRELVQPAIREMVPGHLEGMARRQLVVPSASGELALGDYRFGHILIRDAAYQRALKRLRAELHERFADWLERFDRQRDRPGEHDEIVGYHLEQAFTYGTELGPMNAHTRVLGSRAAEKLAVAGRRAFARGDLPAAVDLLGRAVATLPENDAVRLSLVPELAEALTERGEFDRAVRLLAETEHPSAEAANRPAVARAGLVRLMVDLYSGHEEGWTDRARVTVDDAIPVFEAAGDDAGLATAWRLRYVALGSALKFDEAVLAAEEVVHHAEAAGDIRQQRRGAVVYALSALHGPTSVPDGIARCEGLISSIEGDRRTHAVIQLCLARLVAMDGRIEEARRLYRAAQAMLAELGRSVLAASTSTDAAIVELLAEDLPAAEALLRRDYADLEELGETYLRSSVAGLLARVLVLRGERDEAERIAEEARQIAAPDDVEAQILWRSAVARVRALQGRADEAVALAAEAEALTRDASAPLLRAQALTDRALVLLTAERADQAAGDLAEAIELYRAKGNRPAAEAARRLGSGLPATSP